MRGHAPITDWQTQDISPKERYAQLVEKMQWLARGLQIFGVHVHVGVRSPDKIIPIVNALTSTSRTSSPVGVLAVLGRRRHRSGQRPVQGVRGHADGGSALPAVGWDGFEEYMETLISTHAIESVREVWWDIRPHPDFGTVELRICDGLPTLDEIGAVAR